MKRLILLLLPVLFFWGCEGNQAPSETGQWVLPDRHFQVGQMEICLDESFAQAFAPGYEVCFTSEHVDVFVLREDFSMEEGLEDKSLAEYGKAMLEGNSLSGDTEVKTEGGLTYCEYTATLGEINFHYSTYLFKTEDAFWLVQFAVPEDFQNALQSSVEKWARSISFRSNESAIAEE